MQDKIVDRLRGINDPRDLVQYVRLPRRQPTGALVNIERVRIMAAANHKWRVARMSELRRKKHERDCSMCHTVFSWQRPKGRA